MVRGISLLAIGIVLYNLIQNDKFRRMDLNGVRQYSSFGRYQMNMIIGFFAKLLCLGMLLSGLYLIVLSFFA